MKTTINEKITISEPTPEIINWCEQNLIVKNPVYQQLKIMGKEDTIRWKHIPENLNMYSLIGDDLVLPFGLLKAIWKLINKDKIFINFNDNKPISIKDKKATIDYYDYQEEAIDAMVKAKGGVLVAQCGAGKTYMGTEIIRRIGKRTLWLCHTGDLLRQARDDMKELYPDIKIGLTTKGKLEIGDDVTISTIQTMVNIDPNLYKDKFDVVICDESAHVAASPTQMKMFAKVISNIPARYKYGLTATPARADGMIKAMYCYIGCSNEGLFAPTFKVDKSKVSTLIAEHQKVELNNGYSELDMMVDIYDSSGMIVYNELIASLSANSKRTDKILDNVIKCAKEGRKQVVLTLRVDHCEEIVEKLKSKGINTVLCVGKVSSKKRAEILKQEVNWDVIVATYSLLKEGVSVKELDTLHLVTPVKDKSMIVQCAGRIERVKEGKKQPIIFDYVDVDIPYCEKAYTARRRALKTRF